MPVFAERHLLIEPRLGGLTKVEGVVETEYGPVPVSWEYTSGRLDFRIEVPPGVNATVHLPTAGNTPACVLDGATRTGEVTGRYLSLELKSGKHIGSTTMSPGAARNAPPRPDAR
jgi:hypothetical protein